jgi:hypothetical protein
MVGYERNLNGLKIIVGMRPAGVPEPPDPPYGVLGPVSLAWSQNGWLCTDSKGMQYLYNIDYNCWYLLPGILPYAVWSTTSPTPQMVIPTPQYPPSAENKRNDEIPPPRPKKLNVSPEALFAINANTIMEERFL